MSDTKCFLLVLCIVKGVHQWREDFKIDADFTGTTCLDLIDHREFSLEAPSFVSCAFACRTSVSCMGVSFQNSTGQCNGCRCKTMRPDTDRLTLDGAVFGVRAPASLFKGRCGRIADDGITAEYHLAPGGAYTTGTAPSVRIDATSIWRPDRNETYFLKVDFADGKRLVHGVGIQGWLEGNNTLEYVTAYSVFNSPDCVSKEYVDSKGLNRQLGSSTEKYHTYLDTPLHTQCVFIRVDAWVHYPSIRFQLVGY